MPVDPVLESKPKIVTSVDWKNFFIALFFGTTIIGVGFSAFYFFELTGITSPFPINFSKEASPSANQASPSAQKGSSNVKLKSLLAEPSKYLDKIICTEGIYYEAFESSILVESFDEDEGIAFDKSIWITNTTSKSIVSDLDTSSESATKKIKVCGKFETGKKYGHLDAYSYRLIIDSFTSLGLTSYISN